MSTKRKQKTPEIEQWVREEVRRAGEVKGPVAPIPPTRVLGERFGISHATVFRMLLRLEHEGVVWRAANGRFYPTTARRYIENVLPVACLIRRLQDWFWLCRDVMEGFTSACAEAEMPILLLQRNELLKQADSHSPVNISDVATQTEVLKDFCRIYGSRVSGLLLDELWADAAIQAAREMLPPTVLFFRPVSVEGIGNVAGDFASAAMLGLGHLMACGYSPIYLVRPFKGYEPASKMLEAAKGAFAKLAAEHLPAHRVLDLQDPAALKKAVETAAKKRVGFFCPEDNASLYLLERLQAGGVAVPEQAGIVSGMGTSLQTHPPLTKVGYDFRLMGQMAAEMLLGGTISRKSLEATLRPGGTTAMRC